MAEKPVFETLTDQERCWAYKYKEHEYTRTNPERTEKRSSWRCALRRGHSGPHYPAPNTHQSPWPNQDEPPKRRLVRVGGK